MFRPGKLIITSTAFSLLVESNEHPVELLARHLSLDSGDIDPEDAVKNRHALRYKTGEIMSSFKLKDDQPVWVITYLADTITMILMPEEY